jgi:hypothetical protein
MQFRPGFFFVAFPDDRVYTGLDESNSSLKGIVRSRNLPTEDEVSQESHLESRISDPLPLVEA